jgi:hypothetical protein
MLRENSFNSITPNLGTRKLEERSGDQRHFNIMRVNRVLESISFRRLSFFQDVSVAFSHVFGDGAKFGPSPECSEERRFY